MNLPYPQTPVQTPLGQPQGQTVSEAQPQRSFWCCEQFDAMTADVAAQRSTYLAPRMVVILLLVLLGVTTLAAIGWVLLVFDLLAAPSA